MNVIEGLTYLGSLLHIKQKDLSVFLAYHLMELEIHTARVPTRIVVSDQLAHSATSNNLLHLPPAETLRGFILRGIRRVGVLE